MKLVYVRSPMRKLKTREIHLIQMKKRRKPLIFQKPQCKEMLKVQRNDKRDPSPILVLS